MSRLPVWGLTSGSRVPDGADSAGFAARVRARIGPFAAVSDQSDARLVLRVSGPRVRDVLAKGVPVDLHPKAFKPGDIACTVVGYINTQIDMLDEATYQLAGAAQHGGQLLVVAHHLPLPNSVTK